MPKGVVNTPRDEHLWTKAKAAVREQYTNVAEGSDRFYRLVMGIYKRMKGEGAKVRKSTSTPAGEWCVAPDGTAVFLQEMRPLEKAVVRVKPSTRQGKPVKGYTQQRKEAKHPKEGKQQLTALPDVIDSTHPLKGYTLMAMRGNPTTKRSAEIRLAKLKSSQRNDPELSGWHLALREWSSSYPGEASTFDVVGIRPKTKDELWEDHIHDLCQDLWQKAKEKFPGDNQDIERGDEYDRLRIAAGIDPEHPFAKSLLHKAVVRVKPSTRKGKPVKGYTQQRKEGKQAKELRDLAELGMKPRAYRKKADEWDAEADALEKLATIHKALRLRSGGQGQGKARRGDAGADACVCPECGRRFKHKRGKPCAERRCPDCEVPLQGANTVRKAYVRVRPHSRRRGAVRVAGYTKRTKPKASTTLRESKDKIYEIPISQIEPDPQQHRKRFPKAEMQELADSIREIGYNHTPIEVRPVKGRGKVEYRIISGERRYRACKMNNMSTIRAIIRTGISDEEALTLQVIENLNRLDVRPTEEATAYRQLADGEIKRAKRRQKWQGQDFDDPDMQASLENLGRRYAAQKSGKQRSRVDYYIVLTDLPDEARQMVDDGQLSPAHAHALLRLTDPGDDNRLHTDPKLRRERELHLVRMARHARAHKEITSAILNGMVTEYIRAQQQESMFSEEEATGGEKQVRRQAQKAKLTRIIGAIADAVQDAWDEKQQAFNVDALTATDLKMVNQQLDGAVDSFEKLGDVIEREMMAREAVEATKRRVVQPQGGSGSRSGVPEVAATRSLFASLSAVLRGQARG